MAERNKGLSVTRPSLDQAIRNARSALQGNYDQLLACRDLWDHTPELTAVVPEELLLPIIGIASQLDGTPLGQERQNWEAKALERIDAEIENFRARLGNDLTIHLRRLLEALGAVGSKIQ